MSIKYKDPDDASPVPSSVNSAFFVVVFDSAQTDTLSVTLNGIKSLYYLCENLCVLMVVFDSAQTDKEIGGG